MKRRRLHPNDEVILIFDVDLGFIQQSVRFKEYRGIIQNGVKHDTPIFERNTSEVTGLDCFWILPGDIENDSEIIQMQHELIELQLKASELAMFWGYKIPEKIKDTEIQKMASNNAEFRAKLVSEFGYDPLDYSWVEKELAINELEQSWFTFQRENRGSFNDRWEEHAKRFKDTYHKTISIEEAFDLSRKWKRYLAGAWNTIASHNTNMADWKSAARKFEKYHREIETRQMKWSMEHQDAYPNIKNTKPIHFRHGPYFNECVERVPKLFTDATCYFIRPDVVFQIMAYDPETKYIKLEFTPDIREQIKPGIPLNDPWRPIRADYIIYLPPDQVETHLDVEGYL